MIRIGRLPWLHTALFAIYPVVYLHALNTGEVPFAEAFRPMLVCGLGGGLLAVALGVLLRARHTGGAVATLLVLSFFVGYGAFAGRALVRVSEQVNIGVRYVFVIYALLVFCVALVIIWRKLGGERATGSLNLVAFLLVAIASVQLVGGVFRAPVSSVPDGVLPVPETLASATATAKPDIYFIVLDAYGRADTLREVFGFDNTPFLDAMKQRGFHVADGAHTNYLWTNQSLPACLNMAYLERIAEVVPDYETLNPRALYQNAVTHRVLRAQGYHLSATETRDPLSEPDETFDTVLHYAPGALALSRFELTLLDYTPLLRVLRLFGVNPGYRLWRGRILHMLEHLGEPAAAQSDPVYQQVHIICPHRPFVFAANGDAADPDEAFSLVARPGLDPPFEVLARQYVDQVRGLNVHVLNVVDALLASADTPPVIVIVSDHGPPLHSVYGDGRQNILMITRTPNGAAPPEDINLVELWPWILHTQLGLPEMAQRQERSEAR